MLSHVVSLLEKGDRASRDAVTLFFCQNFGRITRQPEMPDYPPERMLYAAVWYLCKQHPDIHDAVDRCLALKQADNLQHAIYCHFHGLAGNICENGQYRPLKGSPFGLAYCGRDNVCVCKRRAVTIAAAKRSHEDSEQIKAKRASTMMERYGVENAMHDPALVQDMTESVRKRTVEQRNDTLVKRSETNLARYGYAHVFCSEEVKARIQETNLERYGFANPGQVPELQKKAADTLEARTGYRHVWSDPDVIAIAREKYKAQWPEISERIKTTNRERFGVDYPRQRADLQAAYSQAFQERYGVHCVSLVPEFQSKARATRLAKTGYEHQWSDPAVRDRIRRDLFARSGVFHHSQTHISAETLDLLASEEGLAAFMATRSARGAAAELGIEYTTLCKACARHGIALQGNRSSYEREIEAFLADLGVEAVSNTRGLIGFELDFVIPEYRFAIEFNGLYYHSDAPRGRPDPLYHRRKWELCRDAGLQLISINEDEWINRPDVIKRKIANLCGASRRGKGARKLSVRPISGTVAQKFFDLHHIQGKTSAVIYAMGAFDGDELIAAISYGKQRSTGAVELTRFCTDGRIFAGVFSRLFKSSVDHFQLSDVVSFADLRYSMGRVYEVNGFEAVGEIRPDYRYVKGIKTYHKSYFSKSNLVRRGIDVKDRTEHEVARSLGYYRIYDCGKIKYRWRR